MCSDSCVCLVCFRLQAPDPSTVRPKAVLERALARLQERWSNKEADYLYICSQLKAIRQDLTVQHIKDEFSVVVYEYHGRVALEEVYYRNFILFYFIFFVCFVFFFLLFAGCCALQIYI